MQNNTTRKRKVSHLLVLVLISAAMMIIMQVTTGNYLARPNLLTLSRSVAITALIGFSQMICMSSGAMNLAVGGMGGLAGMMMGMMLERYGVSTPVAMLASLGAVLLCGLLNALLIYRNGGVGVASFLVTLATNSIFNGIILTSNKSKTYYGITDSFKAIGMTEVGVISSGLILTIVIGILLWYFYNRMRMGRWILSFGSNWKASELYGVSRFKVILTTHLLCSLMCGLAGWLTVMRLDAAPCDMGSQWMLISFSAALIGGCLIDGGKVSIFGTILGALIVTIVNNALVFIKADIYWYDLFNGIIILIVVAVSAFGQKRAQQAEA